MPAATIESADTCIAASTPVQQRVKLLGAFAVAVLTLGYLLLWFNRFLGAGSDGVLFYMAERILEGKIPYRDFYLITPPLSILKFVAIISVFGHELITVRYIELIERTALATALYYWLARLFPVRYSVLAAFAALILYSGDPADCMAYYPTDGSLCAIAAGLLASIYVGTGGKKHRFLFCSGLLSGLSFLSKQTTGAGVIAAITIVIAVCLLRARRGQDAFKACAMFTAGWLLPLVVTLSWLYRHDALPQFVDQVFVSGASSKGPLLSVFARPIVETATNILNAILALLAALLLIAAYRAPRSQPKPLERVESVVQLARTASLCAAALVAGILLALSAPIAHSLLYLRIGLLTLPYVAIVGTIAYALWLASRWTKSPSEEKWPELAMMCGVSTALAYMYSLSWTPYEPMVLPGIALLLCTAFQVLSNRGKTWLVALSLACVAVSIANKQTAPFVWSNWHEPSVYADRAPAPVPGLEGFRLSAESASAVKRIIQAIDANSSPGDPVFAFPYYPQLYVLSHRQPPTFAVVHYFDVAPDRQARSDADILMRNPPAVLAFMDMPAEYFNDAEGSFRGGRHDSGQRYMLETVRTLATNYKLIESVNIPGWSRKILVYARPREQS